MVPWHECLFHGNKPSKSHKNNKKTDLKKIEPSESSMWISCLISQSRSIAFEPAHKSGFAKTTLKTPSELQSEKSSFIRNEQQDMDCLYRLHYRMGIIMKSWIGTFYQTLYALHMVYPLFYVWNILFWYFFFPVHIHNVFLLAWRTFFDHSLCWCADVYTRFLVNFK